MAGLYLAAVLAACGRPAAGPRAASPAAPTGAVPGGGTATPAAPAKVTASAPPATATSTAEPLAATVNGEPITLAEYEGEVARCEAGLTAAGHDPAGCRAAGLQNLVEQRVMEQAAAAAGLAVSEAEVDAALSEIERAQGGPEALAGWLSANGYTREQFREALRRERLRAQVAEQATAAVGPAAEQVHARAILLTGEETAQAVLDELQAGADFATLALDYSRDLSSRAAGGDLGWFPRGVLTVPEVEEVAFALQPGEVSAIVRSRLGFHIVQVLERQPERPLSPAAAQTLRAAAYNAWLDGLLASAVVVPYVTP